MNISALRIRNINLTTLLALILILSIGSAACRAKVRAPPTPTSAPTSTPTQPVESALIPVGNLFESAWSLVGYGNPTNPTILPRNTLVTVVFAVDGSLAGSSACNQYNTTFEADDTGKLTTKPEIITTRMTCPDDIMVLEQAYLQALAAARDFNFSADGNLEISYTDQQGAPAKLFFVLGQAPLTNTTWTLSSYGESDSLQPLPAGTLITASFSEDGVLAGSAGCNTYATSYTAQDGDLSLQPVASTKMICAAGMEPKAAARLLNTCTRILGHIIYK
jgi:heat shock protein HslJ